MSSTAIRQRSLAVLPLGLVALPAPAAPLASQEASPPRSVRLHEWQASDEAANRAMERYANGDDSAFAVVYDAIAPRLHAYLRRQTRDTIAADDLLQNTLLRIHRQRGSYLTGAAVLPWAFAIARRLYIDELRRKKADALQGARAVAEDDGLAASAADEALSLRQITELVENELARIPESQRIAFELVRVDGLSHDQAAQALGTTVNAIKLRTFRAYEALRAVLGYRPAERDEPA